MPAADMAVKDCRLVGGLMLTLNHQKIRLPKMIIQPRTAMKISSLNIVGLMLLFVDAKNYADW
ncbi:hypothetical protein TH468_05940 [Thalassospira sp. MCCC 1A03138]|nr:hypothetical protein TH468_05940 [Thalassospira sp. MCCC 1A03138]